MIILRKPATQTLPSSSTLVAGELIGDKNGTNRVFTTAFDYQPDGITISYNGQLLYSPYDFEQSDTNEITFVYIKPEDNDIIKAIYQVLTSTYLNLDLVYNSGVWQSVSSYSEIPSDMKVYVNGIKQDDLYYQADIVSNKIEISFGFYTSVNDWVNIEANIPSNPTEVDMVYNSGTWETPTASYSQVPSNLNIYLNGIKQNDDYYVTSLGAGKVRVNFEFLTTSEDWVSMLIL